MDTEKEITDSKFNLTAFRIFFLMQIILNKKGISLSELNDALIDQPEIGRIYTNETLRKYIYTLKKVGCNIKIAGRGQTMNYQLLSSPIPFNLDKNQSQAIKAVLHVLHRQPIHVLYQNFTEFLDWLSVYYQPQFPQLLETPSIDEKIENFQSLCNQKQRICVGSKNKHGKIFQYVLDPIELKCEAGKTFLVSTDVNTYKKMVIDLQDIISLKQMYTSASTKPIQVQVQFILKDRVAQNYRKRPNEECTWQGDQLLVKSKTDDVDELIQRLIRYDKDCEIISPQGVREKMYSKIEQYYETLQLANTVEDELFVDLYIHSKMSSQQDTFNLEPA